MSPAPTAPDATDRDQEQANSSFKNSFTVYIVDDDDSVRDAMLGVVKSMEYQAVGYESAEEFLNQYDGTPGVLVCDLRMPGMTGLELQQAISDRHLFIPFVMITGFAKPRFVVEAVKNGAITVLEKPFSTDDLWLALREASAVYEVGHEDHQAALRAKECLASLKPEEHEVLELVLNGVPNREIAEQLDVSVRTVETRRQRISKKMQVGSIVELVRIVDLARST